MSITQTDPYYEGYIAGYRDGTQDARNEKSAMMLELNISNLPLKAMALSTRAFNCLSRAGCVYIADVAALSGQTIATMRNMGIKTILEIAHWLEAHEIRCSAWSAYL